MKKHLFSSTRLGKLTLQNRIVMAPMTRTRANADHVPSDIMADYYAQRASAGLIIAEATGVSVNGSGYARMPSIYTSEQVRAWKKVTAATHAQGGKIFVQLMHTGRVSHPANIDLRGHVYAPSAIRAPGDIFTDAHGMQPHPIPLEMTGSDIEKAIEEFVEAARNSIEAGFDGVEIHGANGYLIEQFLRPNSNQRTDRFGGSIENRARFLFEITNRVGQAIGFDRVGVRLSPRGIFNDMALYAEIDADYAFITKKLSDLGIVYVHVLDHGTKEEPQLSAELRQTLRAAFKGTYVTAGGYDPESAESDLAREYAQLVAFGKPFIANPDLVERYRNGYPLTEMNGQTVYGKDEKGYSDYPNYAQKSA